MQINIVGEFVFFALPSAKYAADLSSSTKSILKKSLLFKKLFTKGVDLDPGLITTFLIPRQNELK